MSLQLTDSQQVNLTVEPVDKKGNQATIDAAPTWTSSDATVATVTPAADGLSATVVAVGKLGTAQIVITASSGGTSVSGTLDLVVVGGAAASLAITAGAPVEQA